MTTNDATKNVEDGPLILAVDDDPDARMLMRHALQREGLRVITANDGAEALILYQQHRPQIVLIDATMPKMDGFETCRRLRQLPEGADVPIIMVTCLIDDYSVERAFKAGVSEYVTKPVQWSVLRHRLKQLLLNPATAATHKPKPKQSEQTRLKQALPQALANQELRVYYQPQIAPTTRKVVAVEALVRWHHPEMGLVSPVQFIPLAEESGLIVSMGYWILRRACLDLVHWQKTGQDFFIMGVNVSAVQLVEPDFVEQVELILAQTGLDPRWLELEVTEGMNLQNAPEASHKLTRLRRLGISIAVDDFGTGYSSLSYLHQLPLDSLKIDSSFVRTIDLDDQNGKRPGEAIVRAIVVMAQNLGLTIVAEGVERQTQLEILTQLGCDRIQGYLFSKPIPENEFAVAFLNRPFLENGLTASLLT
jgi:EAL domain-containing protein (putative c-di-GMP-specific phosphodiesterase class I)/ActR/RegA family two-component response regulator